MHMAQEDALEVTQDLPHTRAAVGIVPESACKLAPCVFAAVQQYGAMMRDLYEGAGHWQDANQ